MASKLRQTANRVVRLLAKVIGSRIRDARTGEVLGKAILIPWRGRIHVLGYEGEKPLVPSFLPTRRARYWKQELGFTHHDDPDFDSEAGRAEDR